MSAPFKKAQDVIEAQVTEVVDTTIDAAVQVDNALVVQDMEAQDSMVTMGSRTYSSEWTPGADEIQMPKLRLAQGLTAEVMSQEAKPGQWLLIGQDPIDECEVVILKAGKARELRVGTGDDRSVVCRSNDAKVGVGEPGGACEECPLSKWVDNGKGQKGTPPACTLIFSYQCYSLTHDALCIIEFSRTAENQAKLLNTMLVTQGFGGFVARLRSTPKSNGNRRWFEPQVLSRKISPEQRELVEGFLPQR